jgi:hypothetical protein
LIGDNYDTYRKIDSFLDAHGYKSLDDDDNLFTVFVLGAVGIKDSYNCIEDGDDKIPFTIEQIKEQGNYDPTEEWPDALDEEAVSNWSFDQPEDNETIYYVVLNVRS